jgi:hypothetical protein
MKYNQTAEFNHIHDEEDRLNQEIRNLTEPQYLRDEIVTVQQRIDALFSETPIYDSDSEAIRVWKTLAPLTLKNI